MTCFLFIRHGETDVAGRVLVGRREGVALNQRGRAQVETLAGRVRALPPAWICASPLERCQQTAQPLGAAYGLTVQTLPELTELDFGRWQDEHISALSAEPDWQHYNRWRSLHRTPDGELLAEVQLRMVQAMESCQREMPNGVVAFVSHGDPIKAALAYLLGVPLDFINRFSVEPASISVATWTAGEPRLHCINHSGDLVMPPWWETSQ